MFNSMRQNTIRMSAISIMIVLLTSCSGAILVKDVNKKYDNWEIKVVELQDNVIFSGPFDPRVHAKPGGKLVALKISIANNSIESRMIDLKKIILKTDTGKHRPAFIFHSFFKATKVSNVPVLDTQETIERKLVYGMHEHAKIYFLEFPDGSGIHVNK